VWGVTRLLFRSAKWHDPDDINLSTLPVSSRAIIRDQFELALPGAVVSTIPPSVLNGLIDTLHVFLRHYMSLSRILAIYWGTFRFYSVAKPLGLHLSISGGLIVGGVSSGVTENPCLPAIVLPLITSRTIFTICS